MSSYSSLPLHNIDLAYLDNAASEPLRPEVWQAMQQTYQDLGGVGANPASAHAAGRRAAAILQKARTTIAECLNADPVEVVFTGGGTESINLGIQALLEASTRPYNKTNSERSSFFFFSAAEHDAVKIATISAQRLGVSSKIIPITSEGKIDLNNIPSILSSLPNNSSLTFSVMYVGNENGIIQPVSKLAAETKSYCSEHNRPTPTFHTDAVQAVGKIPVNFHALGVDALSFTGHKLGGPVNAGALLIKREVTSHNSSTTNQPPTFTSSIGGISSLLSSNSQERGLRAGTQDVLYASALASAVQLATTEVEANHRRHLLLRQQLLEGISHLQTSKGEPLTGIKISTAAETVPGICHFLLDGCEAEALILTLDQAGVCVSAGSACHAGVSRPSAVLLAQGFSEDEALGSLRVSFGWNTTGEDIQRLLAALPRAVELSRRFKNRK